MSNKEGDPPREIAVVDDSMRRENDVEESKETTLFADQSHEVQVDVPATVEEVPNPYVFQGLKEFLERPVPLLTFTWALSSTFGSCIQKIVLPDALFNLPFIWEKLRHFQYFRAGLHFRVKINATLYHYGKLLMVWRPNALGKTTNGYGTGSTAGAYDNIYTLSSFPSIQVAPNSSETQEMQVSYFLPYQWLDLLSFGSTTGVNAGHSAFQRYLMNMGILEFWVLTPLQASGAANDPPATVSLYVNFIDVELAGYTPMQIVYQNLNSPIVTAPAVPTGFNYDGVVLPVAQSGSITSNKADANSGIWKVTTMPMQIASASVDLPMVPLTFKQQTSSRSSVEKMPSLQQYVGVPCLLARLQVRSATTAGALLARIPVTPFLHPTTGTTIFPNRLAFLSKLFSFWKGELEYHFQVVCSKFHSFRFRVYWTPYSAQTSSVAYVSNTVNKVVDVQGETNFSIVVPWLQKAPLLRLNTNRDSFNGFLMVDLLNPLVYPTTPIPMVTINIWVSARSLEFEKLEGWYVNLPTRQVQLPSAPTRSTDEERTEKIVKKILRKSLPVVQSGVFDPEAQGTRKPIQGKEVCVPEAVKIVGEKLVDFIDIIQKPSSLTDLTNNTRLWYTPFTFEDSGNNAKQFHTLLEYLQLSFVGYSGSVEFWVPQIADVFFIPWISANQYFSKANSTVTLQTLLSTNSHEHVAYFKNVGNGVGTHKAAALPFFSNLMYRPFMLNTFGTDSSIAFPGLDVHVRGAQDNLTYVLMRGGGDFNFHFAVGPPSLSVPPATVGVEKEKEEKAPAGGGNLDPTS